MMTIQAGLGKIWENINMRARLKVMFLSERLQVRRKIENGRVLRSFEVRGVRLKDRSTGSSSGNNNRA